MILILGGTTEGRKAVQVVESAGKPYYYSTVGNEQAIETVHAIRLTGGMDEEEMARFCREKEISLLVDAAHPFAIQLHRTLAKVSSRLRIPVVRLERQYPAHDKRLIWCTDYAAAIDRLRADGICNLLALTGVKTIAKLRPYWEQTPCWFRILNRKESLSLAEFNGFPKERIIFFHEGEDEKKLLDRLHPDAILTKESGESGYFKEKVEAAQACGIPVYVIQRPPLPDSFTFVQGLERLRKAIERLAPGFFPLRNGFTTGACATAAAKAALVALLSQTVQTTSCITLPSGEKITLPVTATEWVENAALCTVIKDSGDDPDVTNGCSVIARIELQAGQSPVPVILFRGGEGVGTVTLPGLGLEIGGPAINATPRRPDYRRTDNSTGRKRPVGQDKGGGRYDLRSGRERVGCPDIQPEVGNCRRNLDHRDIRNRTPFLERCLYCLDQERSRSCESNRMLPPRHQLRGEKRAFPERLPVGTVVGRTSSTDVRALRELYRRNTENSCRTAIRRSHHGNHDRQSRQTGRRSTGHAQQESRHEQNLPERTGRKGRLQTGIRTNNRFPDTGQGTMGTVQ